MGNHQVVIHLYRHLRISDSHIPGTCHLKCYCTTGHWQVEDRRRQVHLSRIEFMKSALQLPQGRLHSLKLGWRIVGMVPEHRRKANSYPILKRCCHSRRIATSTESTFNFSLQAHSLPWDWHTVGHRGHPRATLATSLRLGHSNADVSDARIRMCSLFVFFICGLYL
jgi:hypothetical protein